MKRICDWGGISLIPETAEELAALELVAASELVTSYDDGSVYWVDEIVLRRGFPTEETVTLPMGKSLELCR